MSRVQCIECASYSFRESREMAALGFGSCKVARDPGTYPAPTFERSCARFVQAKGDDVAARTEFLEKVRSSHTRELK